MTTDYHFHACMGCGAGMIACDGDCITNEYAHCSMCREEIARGEQA